MTEKLQVSCNVDLYGGDVKAGVWYDVTHQDGDYFQFTDSSGDIIGDLRLEGNHLKHNPGAEWSFREVEDGKHIYCTGVDEHEDGSATIHFDLPDEAQKVFAELGLKLVLCLHVYNMTEEQLWDMIKESKDDRD